MEISKSKYKHDTRCKVCSAQDPEGNSLRDLVDQMIVNGSKNVDAIEFLDKHGVSVTPRNFSRHLSNHAAFAREARSQKKENSKALEISRKFEDEIRDAATALERIVSYGDQMVENWAQGSDGPKMPVSERLYIEAIKEQGRRNTPTILDAIFLEMDRELIEAEVVEN